MLEKPVQPSGHRTGDQAHLILNGLVVGKVTAHGQSASWGYGDFEPFPPFEKFAPVFGAWSLLMHADEDNGKLSEAAREELRVAEYAMDALRAEMKWDGRDSTTKLLQVNIDGKLVEWKYD